MWGHYGCRIMGVFLGFLNEVSSSTTNIFWWYRFFFMEDCAPFALLGTWALVV
jgi:hypothetical protein